MQAAVVNFPGSNCDHDMVYALGTILGMDVREIWHKDALPPDYSIDNWVVLPGGFSYGDYLRCGAVARFSNVMHSVIDFANRGGKVLGVCNGFQILCEAHLLPGVLLRNKDQNFICKNTYLSVQTNKTILTSSLSISEILEIPIAHAEGRYFADDSTLARLNANDQILFRYCDQNGEINDSANYNGAMENIAGICNSRRNVFGMMPHPERAAEALLGNDDGLKILNNLLENTAVLS